MTATRVTPGAISFEQLQPFPEHAEFGRGKTSGVAARPRQAVDVAGADRVDRRYEHDRHGAARLLQHPHDRAGGGDDDVGRECDQFRRVSAKAVEIAPAPAGVQPHVATDSPAQFLQALCERRDAGQCVRIVRGLAHKDADAPQLRRRLLRARRERPCGRRTTDKGDEFPSPHGALKPRTIPYHILESEGCASQQNRPLDFRIGSKTGCPRMSPLSPLHPQCGVRPWGRTGRG
jgi:hypothetical protein